MPTWTVPTSSSPILRGADLDGADLRGADLTNADLSHADLTNADLSGAVLRWRDLSGADLSGATMGNVSLCEIGLSGGDVRVIYDDATTWPIGSIPRQAHTTTSTAGAEPAPPAPVHAPRRTSGRASAAMFKSMVLSDLLRRSRR